MPSISTGDLWLPLVLQEIDSHNEVYRRLSTSRGGTLAEKPLLCSDLLTAPQKGRIPWQEPHRHFDT